MEGSGGKDKDICVYLVPHTATCSAVIGVVLMVARHANLAGMRHAACGMRKTAHGKADEETETGREREQ